VSKNVGIVTHPEIHIFVLVHIPDFGALCFLDKERIRWEVMNVMRDTPRHDLFGSFEEVF
jgi:hypothetical protein